MESGGQPPGAVPVDEHEQGKLVECVRSPGLLLAWPTKREPPHVSDGHALIYEPCMFDLITRPATLALSPSLLAAANMREWIV